ncbi:hypothetical protein B0T14DRAFT_570013 [Immersiella caudata]|uniref:Uncharacterized protein n=1 Tax=Immersiella caudata TaxID=314043 RepID=A0AA39WEQ4_9PEZI|nr:hypothetical protein B0T14DRAFT_570013 [Immersiella caudata]
MVFGPLGFFWGLSGTSDTRLLVSVLDIFLIEGSTRQTLDTEYDKLLEEYGGQVHSIKHLRRALWHHCRELDPILRHRGLGMALTRRLLKDYLAIYREATWEEPTTLSRLYWLRDLKVDWLEKQIDSVRLAIKTNYDNIKDLKEEIRRVQGQVSDSRDEIAEQQRLFAVAHQSEREDHQSFYNKWKKYRKKGSPVAQPFDTDYIPSGLWREAAGPPPRESSQEQGLLPLHAAAVTAQASRSYTALQSELVLASPSQFGSNPTLTAPSSPSLEHWIEDKMDEDVDVGSPVTHSLTGLSHSAMTLYISPPTGPAFTSADNGQEDVAMMDIADIADIDTPPVERLKRQFASPAPASPNIRFGYAAQETTRASFTPAAPLSWVPNSASAVVAPPQTPAKVAPIANAPRWRPNGKPAEHRRRNAVTNVVPEKQAPPSNPASASVNGVVAQSLESAKGPVQYAFAPLSQNSGNAVPSPIQTLSDAAMKHGNSTTDPPAPKKSKASRVYGHEVMQRKEKFKFLARSLDLSNVDDDGPANSVAVASSGETAVFHNSTIPSRSYLLPKDRRRGKKKSDSQATSSTDEVVGMREEKPLTTSGSTASGTVTGPSGPAVMHASGGSLSAEVNVADPAPAVYQAPLSSGVAATANAHGNGTAAAPAAPPSNRPKWRLFTGDKFNGFMTEKVIPKVFEELLVSPENGSIPHSDVSLIHTFQLSLVMEVPARVDMGDDKAVFQLPVLCGDWIAKFFYDRNDGMLMDSARLPAHYGLEKVKRRVLSRIQSIMSNRGVVIPSGIYNGYPVSS